MDQQWIIVSNRLPFTKDSKGKIQPGSGGLISAITGINTDKKVKWVGAVPDMTEAEWKAEQLSTSRTELVPLFLPPDDYDNYYNQVANDVLWPLFHYESNLMKFSWENWDNYRKVNRLFAEKINSVARPGDLVWIHDFHLFLVPGYLKKLNPKLRTGFFLHIPFPSSEIFRQLPVREEILESLLSSDLVGFHDYSYLKHFSASLHWVLGIEVNMHRIVRGRMHTKLGVFPVSIDTKRFQKKAKSFGVAVEIRKLKRSVKTEFLILGVDRLDYIKGIELKLEAFRAMLRKHPKLRGKVSLLQIAVPSRTGVEEYNLLKGRIDMLVGEINGEFGKFGYTPVQYQFSTVSFTELLSLYRLADILLVTSKRDGMNLVCLEYLASQDPKAPGEVLLSEFTGAVSTLSHVVPINPWDVDGTADEIARGLKAPSKDRRDSHRVMMEYLGRYTATHWAESFMSALGKENEISRNIQVQEVAIKGTQVLVPSEIREQLQNRKLVLMCDYDGTLTPIVDDPRQAHLSRNTARLLRKIAARSGVEVVIVSGRNSKFLVDQFIGIPLALCAEHGAKYLAEGKGRWQSLVRTSRQHWYPTAFQIMQDYAARVPQSYVEKKEYSLSWHYRRSPSEFAHYQGRKLEEDLELGLMNSPAQVVTGKMVIEVRPVEANKGAFASWYLDTPQRSDGLVIALGDDRTDEDLFAAVPKDGVTVKIGEGDTRASYRVSNQENVDSFLHGLFLG